MFSRKNKPFKLLSQGPGRLSEYIYFPELNEELFGRPESSIHHRGSVCRGSLKVEEPRFVYHIYIHSLQVEMPDADPTQS